MNDFRYHHINIGLLEHHLISSIFSQCFISDYRLVTLLFYTNLLQRSATHFSWLFSTKKITETKPTSQKSTPPPSKTPWGSRSFQPPRRMGRSRWPRLRARLHQRRWLQRPGAGHRQRGQQRWILAPLTVQRDHRAKQLGHHPVPSGKETCRYISYPTRNGKGQFHWLK